MNQPDPHAGVKSALRVLDIFELLAQHPEGLSLSEIAAALRIPKSSAHSLIYTLLARHYLPRRLARPQISPGPPPL